MTDGDGDGCRLPRRVRDLLAAGFFAACAAVSWPGPASAQLNISGQADILAKYESEDRGLNRNFRGDSPYNEVRARIFLQHWVTERAGVFGELLFDNVSGPRLNGLYVVLNEVAGKEWLSTRIGMAPSIVGNFSLRSTYFNSNPLIGVPLVYQHRFTLDGSGLATAADLLRRREQNVIALPLMYDACWNIQWEVLGEAGKVEYSLGVTPGSLSNPLASPAEPGVQVHARLGYIASPQLRVGVSGGAGAYLGGPNRDPLTTATSYPGDPEDYQQKVVGFDAEYALGRALFYSEGYLSRWEAPLIDEELQAMSGYVEGRFDFHPEWFAAARVGTMVFSEIQVPDAPSGTTTGWDDDVLRFEASLTHRIAREIQLRGGWQHTEFLTGGEDAIDLLAVQLRAVF